MEKHIKNQKIPEATTLRRCVSDVYKIELDKLQCKAKDKYIWVSLDETTDSEQRSIANFVFGILGDDEEIGKSYLLNLFHLQKCDSSTIAAFYNDSLSLLYPNGTLLLNSLSIQRIILLF